MDDGKLLTLLDTICNAVSNIAGSTPSGVPFAMQQVNRAKAMIAEQHALMAEEAQDSEPSPEDPAAVEPSEPVSLGPASRDAGGRYTGGNDPVVAVPDAPPVPATPEPEPETVPLPPPAA